MCHLDTAGESELRQLHRERERLVEHGQLLEELRPVELDAIELDGPGPDHGLLVAAGVALGAAITLAAVRALRWW